MWRFANIHHQLAMAADGVMSVGLDRLQGYTHTQTQTPTGVQCLQSSTDSVLHRGRLRLKLWDTSGVENVTLPLADSINNRRFAKYVIQKKKKQQQQ